jgi:hypothetical protein
MATMEPKRQRMTKLLIPDPLNSDAEYARFHFLDIPELDNIELRDELNYIKALLWGIPAEHWLRERVRQLETEITRRKYSDSQLPQAKPKARPKRLAGGVRL